MECALRSAAQFIPEHVHKQPIVPGAVGAALVAAHDTYLAEARLLVGADRGRVVGRWIDREAMVAALFEEVAGEETDRFGAQPLAVPGCSEKDVHVRVAVRRLVLLPVLDRADDLPVYLDDEALVRLYEPLTDLLDVGAAPPPGDIGLLSDPDQPVGVLGAAGTQQHALCQQNDHIALALLPSVRTSPL